MKTTPPTHPFRLRAIVSISGDLYVRLTALRQQLSHRYGIFVDEDRFMDYVCEKAVEKLDEWQSRGWKQ